MDGKVYRVTMKSKFFIGIVLLIIVLLIIVIVFVGPCVRQRMATPNTVTGTEDTQFTFAGGDFTFTDVESDALTRVEITTLPAAGTLKLSGSAVTALDKITVADIGNLTFDPAANANGSPYTTFTFKVEAGAGSWSVAAATMTIDVTAVDDGPGDFS